MYRHCKPTKRENQPTNPLTKKAQTRIHASKKSIKVDPKSLLHLIIIYHKGCKNQNNQGNHPDEIASAPTSLTQVTQHEEHHRHHQRLDRQHVASHHASHHIGFTDIDQNRPPSPHTDIHASPPTDKQTIEQCRTPEQIPSIGHPGKERQQIRWLK